MNLISVRGISPCLFRRVNPLRFFARPPTATPTRPRPHPPVVSEPHVTPTKRRVLIKDFYVSPDESGMRLDRFLKHRIEQDRELPDVNNTVINKWLGKRVKLVRPNDQHEINKPRDEISQNPSTSKARKPISGATRIEAGQTWRVRVLAESADESTEITEDSIESQQKDVLPLQDWIVYMDERAIVLDKPAGVAVQGGSGVELSIDQSLAVLQYGFPEKPRIVHRLDMTTSGLLILARTRKAAQDLTKRFHDGTVETVDSEDEKTILKKYLAIVRSSQPIRYPGQETCVATGSTLRLQGDMVVAVQGRRQSIRMHSYESLAFAPSKTEVVWTSTTDVRISSQSTKNKIHFALLQLYPRTGRKHQLRVHCAQLLNAPILGDAKYSLEETRNGEEPGRLYLHMAELTLKGWLQDGSKAIPKREGGSGYTVLEGGSLVVRAAIPKDMQRRIDQLGLKTH